MKEGWKDSLLGIAIGIVIGGSFVALLYLNRIEQLRKENARLKIIVETPKADNRE